MSKRVTPLDALPTNVQHAVVAGDGYTVCPSCDGGSRRRQTLGIKHVGEGVVRLGCFRVTCGWVCLTLTDPDVEVTRKKFKEGKVYRDPTIMLQGEPQGFLSATYGLKSSEMHSHGWMLDQGTAETLVLPILDPYGRERGHITRTLFESPKRVYTYKATAQPFLDWWIDANNSAPVVVVEDVLSACRLSGLGYNSVALLGTGMSTDDAREIANAADDRAVYLALDRDAFDKAVKLKLRHQHILRITKVLCLNEDIKDMGHDNDILELLSDGRTRTTGSSMQ